MALPTRVHVAPVSELYALIVLPRRTRRTHTAADMAGPVVCAVIRPGFTRRSNARPLPGVTNMKACRASSCSDSRIMMPAFADGSTFCSDATLTRTSRSPEEGRYAKWNSSEVPPTSVPAPMTV